MIRWMSIWRRARADLPAGAYDEVVLDALRSRLTRIATTHACELVDIRRDSDVDEQLVTLVRAAASIVIRAKSDARDKLAVAQRLLDQIAREGAFLARSALLVDPLHACTEIDIGEPLPRRAWMAAIPTLSNYGNQATLWRSGRDSNPRPPA
jgi:hypothetical protein